MDFRKAYLVKGKRFDLAACDPDDTAGITDEREAAARSEKNKDKLAKLQQKLYAEHKRALLIVLQAMDAGGKDGTIRHVMSGVNPQGCSVTSFKQPSSEELSHDFLWRIHRHVPAFGDIGIFNRSHYEDVLVVRVHNLVPESVWSKRYEQIRDFEKMLSASGVEIIKFYLNISKAEQEKRFQSRLNDPDKNWKSSPADFSERKFWKEYHEAYQDVLTRCSRKAAPWYVIPANKKWFRNLAISQIIVDTLVDMNLKYPEISKQPPKEEGAKKP